MSEFTKSPWTAKLGSTRWSVVTNKGHFIAYAVRNPDSHTEAGERANAHLIAAALDLLEALKAAAQFIDPGVDRGPAINGWQNTVDLINAAIAKAEGQ